MIALVVILSVLAGGLAVGLAVALSTAREAATRAELAEQELEDSGYRHLIGERVVVQLADGRAIRCVLDHVYSDSYEIRQPEHLVAGGEPKSLGGAMLVAADEVPLIQLLAEDEPAA